jgi:DNA-binding MarR family transcriptional regulator
MDVHGAPDRLRALPSWLIGQAGLEVRRVVGGAMTAASFHRADYALLAAIEQFGPLSQTELAERSGQDRSDVVRRVDDLAGRGLLKRDQDPADRRRNLISITAPGRRALDDVERTLQAAQARLLHALSPAERQQLVGLLERLLGLR